MQGAMSRPNQLCWQEARLPIFEHILQALGLLRAADEKRHVLGGVEQHGRQRYAPAPGLRSRARHDPSARFPGRGAAREERGGVAVCPHAEEHEVEGNVG